MPRLIRPVFVLTFLLSFATILLQRGIFFLFKEYYQISETCSLLLALVTGAIYVAGACLSHPLARHIPERRALLCLLAGLVGCAGAGLGTRDFWALAAIITIFSMLVGMIWPIVESFVTSGQNAQQASKSVGGFSMSWSLALPLSVWTSGHLIAAGPRILFMAALLFLGAVAALTLALPPRPPPHSHETASQPPPPDYTPLLYASRWTLVGGYALLLILVPLLPIIFTRQGYPVAQATFLAGILEITRPAVFVAMFLTTGWHGHRSLILLSMLMLPLGFALTLFGTSPWIFVPGELIFGIAASVSYYCALYYAMVISHGSVDGGGGHEAVIGIGFTIGPLMALSGQFLGGKTGDAQLGLIAGIAPIILVCLIGTIVCLRRAKRAHCKKNPPQAI